MTGASSHRLTRSSWSSAGNDSDLITHCATRRPNPSRAADPATAAVIALRALARRHQHPTTEITDLDTLIGPLLQAINPALLALTGIGAARGRAGRAGRAW